MKFNLLILLTIFIFSCDNQTNTVVIISANTEWKALSNVLKPTNNKYNRSPYGEWFYTNINNKKVIFYHGGWGKIDAAGSTQYVITEFKPNLIINLGTAGGFPGKVVKGDIILVSKTITYDIYEKMGDSNEAIDYYTTNLSYPKIDMNNSIKISPIVSADQDLFPKNIKMLYNKYGAFAGDWESSAIAHVAKKNNVKCYVIRGITDIVYQSGSSTYGNYSEFEKETEIVMNKLVKLLYKII